MEFGPGVTELSMTAIETRTGGPTVRVVEPLTSPLTGDQDAVITVVPATKVVARPVSEMDATAGVEELQVTKELTSRVALSLKVPCAVNS